MKESTKISRAARRVRKRDLWELVHSDLPRIHWLLLEEGGLTIKYQKEIDNAETHREIEEGPWPSELATFYFFNPKESTRVFVIVSIDLPFMIILDRSKEGLKQCNWVEQEIFTSFLAGALRSRTLHSQLYYFKYFDTIQMDFSQWYTGPTDLVPAPLKA